MPSFGPGPTSEFTTYGRFAGTIPSLARDKEDGRYALRGDHAALLLTPEGLVKCLPSVDVPLLEHEAHASPLRLEAQACPQLTPHSSSVDDGRVAPARSATNGHCDPGSATRHGRLNPNARPAAPDPERHRVGRASVTADLQGRSTCGGSLTRHGAVDSRETRRSVWPTRTRRRRGDAGHGAAVARSVQTAAHDVPSSLFS